jgi:hypothetical protein
VICSINNEIVAMGRLNRSIYSCIQIIAMCLLFSSGHAAVYKWVDADGNTNYTQHPPPVDIEGDIIKPPPDIDTKGALKGLNENQKLLEDKQKEREKQAEDQEFDEANAAIRRSNCQLGRDKMASLRLTAKPQSRSVSEDGTVYKKTEEQWQAEIKQAQEIIDKNCN